MRLPESTPSGDSKFKIVPLRFEPWILNLKKVNLLLPV
jgi:hypothetical protein